MSDRNIQSSTSAMKHQMSGHKKGRKGARMLSRPQFAATKSNHGFGHFGAQSYGGRGK